MNIKTTFQADDPILDRLDEQQLLIEVITHLSNISEYLRSLEERVAHIEQTMPDYQD